MTPVRERFVVTLFSTAFRAAVGLATAIALARALGPDDFGRASFLLASFLAVKQLLDMGSGAAFFTFLAQRPRSARFVRAYWAWVGLQFTVSLALVGFVLPAGWVVRLWPGEDRVLVMLGLAAAFTQGVVWPAAAQMAEAQRRTRPVQLLNSVIVLAHLAAVLLLWRLGRLGIAAVLGLTAVEWAIGGWLAARMYQPATGGPEEDDGGLVRTYWTYCRPLVPYVWLGCFHDFADRWMLQEWAGAGQQAYFSIAQQFAAVALLATVALMRIFWQEISEAHFRGDAARVEALYRRASRGLLLVAALAAGLVIPWSAELTRLVLGPAYGSGAAALALMFLYPVHQTTGQFGGTLLAATGRTALQSAIGMGGMLAGLATTWLLLAPPTAPVPGLGLGAEGLAIKMVALQILTVNVQEWLISRTLGWRFAWGHQWLSMGLGLLLGWVAKAVTDTLFAPEALAVRAATAGLLFSLLALGAVAAVPGLAGMNRSQLRSLLSRHRGGSA